MNVLTALLTAREARVPCALVTVAATQGSVPRAAGAKMLVYAQGGSVGTIGGGKFEALVIAEARALIGSTLPRLKTFALHEAAADSFGAICGGEVTVLIEPEAAGPALVVIGAGHCARALAQLAQGCGFHVSVLDDRAAELADFPAELQISTSAEEFIAVHPWRENEALVIVSRHYELDRVALAAALRRSELAYIGMIGSDRKVRRVFDDLRATGFAEADFARVFAPIGLDLGADSPAEIAVSVLAEILQILRARPGGHLRG